MIIHGSEVKIHMDKENSRITQKFHADGNKGIKPRDKIPISVLVQSVMDVLMSSKMGRRVTGG